MNITSICENATTTTCTYTGTLSYTIETMIYVMLWITFTSMIVYLIRQFV